MVAPFPENGIKVTKWSCDVPLNRQEATDMKITAIGIEALRRTHVDYVFTYQGKPMAAMNNTRGRRVV